ncbi:hypothetical protein ABTK14_22570, partial [Acinetobacter baumannii]
EVVINSTEILSEDEWKQFEKLLGEAIGLLNKHRIEEGKALETDLLERLANINIQQEAIIALEPRRRQKIKEGLTKILEENVGAD